jgi:hypothetical protein
MEWGKISLNVEGRKNFFSFSLAFLFAQSREALHLVPFKLKADDIQHT